MTPLGCSELRYTRAVFSFVFCGIAANGSERAAPFPEQSSAVFSKIVFEKTVNDARITGVIHKCALRFLRDFLKRKVNASCAILFDITA